jgi:hypothetical protein
VEQDWDKDWEQDGCEHFVPVLVLVLVLVLDFSSTKLVPCSSTPAIRGHDPASILAGSEYEYEYEYDYENG